MSSIPHPAATLLNAKSASEADHAMPRCGMRLADAEDVTATHHNGRPNYNFVDGHAASHRLTETYHLQKNLARWNALTAP